MHILTGQQLGGVWRCRTSHEQIEVLVNTRWADGTAQIGECNGILHQQLTDTNGTVLYTEQATQGWLTDIETAKHYLFTQQGERYRQVGSEEGFTLT